MSENSRQYLAGFMDGLSVVRLVPASRYTAVKLGSPEGDLKRLIIDRAMVRSMWQDHRVLMTGDRAKKLVADYTQPDLFEKAV